MSARRRVNDMGPFQPSFWRSPLRGPALTSALGFALLCSLPVVMVTGLLSNAAYDPRLGANVQNQGRSISPLDFYLFNWPAHPTWLYAVSQTFHVGLGLAVIPIVLVKQWSVLPRLFVWPPVRSPAHALERLSLAFLVGGIFFEFVTGLLFIEYWLPFHFNFTAAHYFGAWVFFGAFLLHVALKLPTMRAALSDRRALDQLLHANVSATRTEASDEAPNSLISVSPAQATISRRTVLGVTGAGALLLGLQVVAQSVGGPVRALAFMFPRGRTLGSDPNEFPVNGTFAALVSDPDAVKRWRLTVSGRDRTLDFTREQLLAMPQHTSTLPLSCREGWTTTQRWTGIRLRDLAATVGMPPSSLLSMLSLDGAAQTLSANQVEADASLLALSVNGAPLSPDHGFPARVIVPAEVGDDCLKWVHTFTFVAE